MRGHGPAGSTPSTGCASPEATGRCADLELIFERQRPGGTQLHLRVEVKHGSLPHTGQLQAYIDEQRSSGNDAAVLLLAPRQDYPFDSAQVPDEVVQLRWQDTARVIGEWRPDDPVGRFLISELTAFLREEDLVDPEDLKHDHLVALEVHEEALNALERVCELAATRVDSQWNEGDGPGQYGRPVVKERWWTYPPYPREPAAQGVDLGDAWELSWSVHFNGRYLFKDRSASPCFNVGVTAGTPGSIEDLGPDRQRRLEKGGFALLPRGRRNTPRTSTSGESLTLANY
jgi:hypothetical protein